MFNAEDYYAKLFLQPLIDTPNILLSLVAENINIINEIKLIFTLLFNAYNISFSKTGTEQNKMVLFM